MIDASVRVSVVSEGVSPVCFRKRVARPACVHAGASPSVPLEPEREVSFVSVAACAQRHGHIEQSEHGTRDERADLVLDALVAEAAVVDVGEGERNCIIIGHLDLDLGSLIAECAEEAPERAPRLGRDGDELDDVHVRARMRRALIDLEGHVAARYEDEVQALAGEEPRPRRVGAVVPASGFDARAVR